MRLSNKELNAIRKIFHGIFVELDVTANLYLHGSRTDDSKKGGDIDLLLILQGDHQKQAIKLWQAKILGKLYGAIGEQKIDITFACASEKETNPFIRSIFGEAIKII